jgi:hypothetical protein
MKFLTFIAFTTILLSQEKIDIGSNPIKSGAFNLTETVRIVDDEGFYKRVIAVLNTKNDLIVADAGNKRILIYNDGKVVKEFGEEGTGPEEINDIFGLELIGNDRILISTQGDYKVFDYEGRFMGSINSHEHGFSDLVIFKNQIVRIFSNKQSKYLRIHYDKNGEELFKIENRNVQKPEEIKGIKMFYMNSTGGIEYQNLLAKSIGKTYQIDLLDENFEVKKKYQRNFERIKRNFKDFKLSFSFKGSSKKEEAKMRASAEQQMKTQMGEYLSDITDILGTFDDALIVRIASENPQKTLSLDLIKNDKLYTQFTKTFEDNINNVSIANGLLSIAFKNEEIGPYIKLYKITLK